MAKIGKKMAALESVPVSQPGAGFVHGGKNRSNGRFYGSASKLCKGRGAVRAIFLR
jgi:hypothetical protein